MGLIAGLVSSTARLAEYRLPDTLPSISAKGISPRRIGVKRAFFVDHSEPSRKTSMGNSSLLISSEWAIMGMIR